MLSILRSVGGRICVALAICAGSASVLLLSAGAAAAAVTPNCSYSAPELQPAGCGYGGGLPPAVTLSPVDATAYEGDTVQFTAAATNSAAVSWEYSFDNGANWYAAGQYTDTYTLGGLSLGENGDLVRAEFSNSNGVSDTLPATLTVLPAQPIATLAEDALSFGYQPVYTTSGTQTVTVTNTGIRPLDFATAYVDTTRFVIVDDMCSQQVLAPDSACDISVAFAPNAVGTIPGTLAIVDDSGNDADAQQIVDLDGYGFQAPTLGPDATVSGVAGMAFAYPLTVTGSPAPTTRVSAGALPPGLTIDASNTITGTPTAAGTYLATIEADNDTPAPAYEALTFTITPRPRLTVSSASVAEGDSGPTQLIFAYHLSRPATAPASFHFATRNGTATAPSDYARTSGTVTVPAGSQDGTIAVLVRGDLQVEPDEQFTLVLNQPSGLNLGTHVATGTIRNDD